jgi:hypothetical protein
MSANMELEVVYQLVNIYLSDPTIRFIFIVSLSLLGLRVVSGIVRFTFTDGSDNERHIIARELQAQPHHQAIEQDDEHEPVVAPEVKRVSGKCGGCGSKGFVGEPCRYCGEIV